MEEIQQKLAVLDRKSEELVQEGKYLESLDIMEEALTIRRNVFGETSDEYYKTSEKLCELCNMLSMIFLQKEKFEASLEFLKKAEILAQNSIELRAVTYNNMACYYRRIGKLKVALKCLEDALALEVKLDKTKTLADTHLNICAVYSQLGKHDIAMTHIMKSIILLQDELLATSAPTFDENPRQHPSQSDANTKKQFEDRVAVLAIAYHNLGVEHEYLKQYEEAILTYKKAVNFARANLGEESHVCKNLQNVLETAYSQIQETKTKAKQRTFQKPTFGTQMSGTNRFKQASSVYGKEGSASKADGKRISQTGGLDPAYKTESQYVVDTYAKPLSGDMVSASSGFTPLDRGAPGSNQKKFLNDFHDESDAGPNERKTIEESMGEYSNQLSGSEMR